MMRDKMMGDKVKGKVRMDGGREDEKMMMGDKMKR